MSGEVAVFLLGFVTLCIEWLCAFYDWKKEHEVGWRNIFQVPIYQPWSNSLSQWFLYSSLVLPVTTARYLSLRYVNSEEFAFRVEYCESI